MPICRRGGSSNTVAGKVEPGSGTRLTLLGCLSLAHIPTHAHHTHAPACAQAAPRDGAQLTGREVGKAELRMSSQGFKGLLRSETRACEKLWLCCLCPRFKNPKLDISVENRLTYKLHTSSTLCPQKGRSLRGSVSAGSF